MYRLVGDEPSSCFLQVQFAPGTRLAARSSSSVCPSPSPSTLQRSPPSLQKVLLLKSLCAPVNSGSTDRRNRAAALRWFAARFWTTVAVFGEDVSNGCRIDTPTRHRLDREFVRRLPERFPADIGLPCQGWFLHLCHNTVYDLNLRREHGY